MVDHLNIAETFNKYFWNILKKLFISYLNVLQENVVKIAIKIYKNHRNIFFLSKKEFNIPVTPKAHNVRNSLDEIHKLNPKGKNAKYSEKLTFLTF